MFSIKQFLKDLITENDGVSFCPVRILSMGLSVPTVVMFVAGYAASIYQGHFDGQNMALAFTTLCGGFAAIGAGVAAKAFTDTDATKK
jgi:uncharacterized membrane protein